MEKMMRKEEKKKAKNYEKNLIILHCCGWHIPVKVIKSCKLLDGTLSPKKASGSLDPDPGLVVAGPWGLSWAWDAPARTYPERPRGAPRCTVGPMGNELC